MSWTAFQLDAAVLALADDWDHTRGRVLDGEPRDAARAVRRAWDRWVRGERQPEDASPGWLESAAAASRRAKNEARLRAEGATR